MCTGSVGSGVWGCAGGASGTLPSEPLPQALETSASRLTAALRARARAVSDRLDGTLHSVMQSAAATAMPPVQHRTRARVCQRRSEAAGRDRGATLLGERSSGLGPLPSAPPSWSYTALEADFHGKLHALRRGACHGTWPGPRFAHLNMLHLDGLRLERVRASKQFRDGRFHNTSGAQPGLQGNSLSVMGEFFFGRSRG